MSSVVIQRLVENIRSGTNSYTPLIELVVNAIQAVESTNKADGEIKIIVKRSGQMTTDASESTIIGFEISDNGVGFTEKNREAFDTLYTTHKIKAGGKGFGRFTCLKYYNDIHIESVFHNGSCLKFRGFQMGKDQDIIVNEEIVDTKKIDTGTTVRLESIRKAFPDKGLSVIARTLVEKLLPYFIDEERPCPKIWLFDADDSESILLNNYIDNYKDGLISEVTAARGDFFLQGTDGNQLFSVKVFKIYSPKASKSKINLVAHRREVTNTPLQSYIPEFSEEFYDNKSAAGDDKDRNFVLSVYVTGGYLDENVSIERGGFSFQKDNDLLNGIAQNDIELEAATFAQQAVDNDVKERQERKVAQINEYVRSNAPWYADTLKDADFSGLSYNPTPPQIDTYLHQQKFTSETRIKQEAQKLLSSDNPDDVNKKAAEIVAKISESSRSELVHYIALRKNVLDIFAKSLQINEDEKYSSEGTVHDIIFPRRRDSLDTAFEEHNLWIIDERLNFTNYVSSDNSLDGTGKHRPDIIAYDKRVMFRGDNEPSNPVTIFEFKKPQRDDFVNQSSKEDPVKQIVRYVNEARDGNLKTPEGLRVRISENTPFYGYIICDLTPKVEKWLDREKEFKPMPDQQGWFRWRENINLYIEVLSWDKVLKDASMRNRVFFHKLGIE